MESESTEELFRSLKGVDWSMQTTIDGRMRKSMVLVEGNLRMQVLFEGIFLSVLKYYKHIFFFC